MSTQSLLAVTVMSLLALPVIQLVARRTPGWTSSVVAYAVLLIVGTAALRWLPQWSGVVVVGSYVLLSPAPTILLHTAQRQTSAGRPRAAALLTRLAYLLHPAAVLGFNAAVYAALAQRSTEHKVTALRALMPRATPQQQTVLEVSIAQAQDDWTSILAHIQGADEQLRLGLHSLAIRAYGELGLIEQMVQTFARIDVPQSRRDCGLFVLAFTGRLEGLRRLVARRYRSLHTKDYWIAIAAKASGSKDLDWRLLMAAVAARTNNESFRTAAERHLANPQLSPPLTPTTAATVAIIEQELLATPNRPMVLVTALLLFLVIVMFAIEISQRGSESTDTLIRLGALAAPRVLRDGQWWRLATASLLHYPFQFWINLFLLFSLGIISEIRFGSRLMLAICSLGGLAASATALWMMWRGSAAGPLFVGASGIICALVGSETGRVLRHGSRWREAVRLGTRKPILHYLLLWTVVIPILWLDLAVGFHDLHIDYVVHVPAFAVGLIIALVRGGAHDAQPHSRYWHVFD
jgi:membrane associated rhomboid family serine protease